MSNHKAIESILSGLRFKLVEEKRVVNLWANSGGISVVVYKSGSLSSHVTVRQNNSSLIIRCGELAPAAVRDKLHRAIKSLIGE